MRYSWLLTLITIFGIIIFHNVVTPVKTNLTALLTLNSLDEPVAVTQNGRSALIAQVYSTYPFNNHSILTIAAGSEDGVKVGMVVTTDGNYLLGQVTEVFENHSNVRTIFDKNWQLSVRIGQQRVDALLISGQQPLLTMIDRKSIVLEGDEVVSASRDFPFGMKIGTITGVQEAREVSFQEGRLAMPYQENDLKEVAVITR